jgi:hypothetical protein
MQNRGASLCSAGATATTGDAVCTREAGSRTENAVPQEEHVIGNAGSLVNAPALLRKKGVLQDGQLNDI